MSLNAWQQFRDRVGYSVVALGCRFAQVKGNYPITKPINPIDIEVLADPKFQASVTEVADLTLLDTPRLANLWQLCRMTDPRGNILEVGSYKGGGALHLSNSCPERKVIACDSFGGFEKLDAELDHNFDDYMFKDNSRQKVEGLFKSRGRPCEVIAGFFPASCRGKTIAPVSFVHLDADIYKSTIESLNFLEDNRILMEKSLIVLDDYLRHADGVVQAVKEFTAAHKDWMALPMFPGQGLLVPRSSFGA